MPSPIASCGALVGRGGAWVVLGDCQRRPPPALPEFRSCSTPCLIATKVNSRIQSPPSDPPSAHVARPPTCRRRRRPCRSSSHFTSDPPVRSGHQRKVRRRIPHECLGERKSLRTGDALTSRSVSRVYESVEPCPSSPGDLQPGARCASVRPNRIAFGTGAVLKRVSC